MTFEEWFLDEPDGQMSLHDIVLIFGPHKSGDVEFWVKEAFEAGYKQGFEQGKDKGDHEV